MSWTECASIVQNFLVGASALATAGIAYTGLSTWQDQLHGSAEFEIARDLVKSTYRLREAIHRCRSPFILVGEWPPGYSETGKAHEDAKAFAHLYQNRWQPISEALQDFDVCVLEAEALWGDQVQSKSEQLRVVINEVNMNIHSYIENIEAKAQGLPVSRDDDLSIRRVIFASPKNKDNETSRELLDAVKSIIDLVRPHLIHRRKQCKLFLWMTRRRK